MRSLHNAGDAFGDVVGWASKSSCSSCTGGVTCVVVGEYSGSLVVVGDQPMMHPEQLASEDDQC